MPDQVPEPFSVVPDYDLNLMQPAQTLSGLTAHIPAALEPLLAREQPDVVAVQGEAFAVRNAIEIPEMFGDSSAQIAARAPAPAASMQNSHGQ